MSQSDPCAERIAEARADEREKWWGDYKAHGDLRHGIEVLHDPLFWNIGMKDHRLGEKPVACSACSAWLAQSSDTARPVEPPSVAQATARIGMDLLRDTHDNYAKMLADQDAQNERLRAALYEPVCFDDGDGFCSVHNEVGAPCEDEDRERLYKLRALLSQSSDTARPSEIEIELPTHMENVVRVVKGRMVADTARPVPHDPEVCEGPDGDCGCGCFPCADLHDCPPSPDTSARDRIRDEAVKPWRFALLSLGQTGPDGTTCWCLNAPIGEHEGLHNRPCEIARALLPRTNSDTSNSDTDEQEAS